MTALLSLTSSSRSFTEEHSRAIGSYEPSDAQLVDSVRRGSSAAFTMLVERYQKKAQHLAFVIVHDENDASDIVQEAFLRVFRKIAEYSGDSSFYTWFYRIVYNLSVDFLRRPYRRRVGVEQVELLLGAFAPLALPMFDSRRPDDAAFGAELFARISDALDQLSIHQREVVVLREIWGMSYGEMAEHLGCAKGTVMSRLFHARQRLQVLLRDAYSSEFEEEGGATFNHRLNNEPTFDSLST